MKNSSIHIANLNRNLRNSKFKVLVDFICSDPLGIIVVTNKVLLNFNLLTIEKYIKNLKNIDFTQVETPQLPQSKSYLKIISIPYYSHGSYNSQECLSSKYVEDIIKQNQIFDNIILASKPKVIKVSSKSDMVIVWIDIWDAQSGVKSKGLINQCFNVRRYIVMVRMANVNPGIPQCKNCWKQDHSTFSYRIQDLKCIKYNGPHKLENHHKFRWCCKVNDKINPLHLEIKKGKLCPHIFKCTNCQGEHQADSITCPFWKNQFNREWHQKKYLEIHENRVKSIYSVENENMEQ